VGWTQQDIPDLTGKVALITGGNVGLGFESARELAAHGATVVLAARNSDRNAAAVQRINAALSGCEVQALVLDLASPSSIAEFTQQFLARFSRLDILLNNAGVVNLESLQRTDSGHEMHMAVNHYGHFALTAQLFPLLVKTPAARVVTVSSLAYRYADLRLDDMDWRARDYSRTGAYADSKLANLFFMLRLQREFEQVGASAISVAAHPGLTGTERQQSIGIGGVVSRYLAAPVVSGVRPQLLAATAPEVEPGEFYGPRFNLRGAPRQIDLAQLSAQRELIDQLWEYTTVATGVKLLAEP
jgi:NAD(P)-dependent dehydrogenase (short-subunit alcohol dehydrogenase family)